MLKYVETKVVFREIPNEITLAINISRCPCHCQGCHSSYLAEDIGELLTDEALFTLVQKNRGITCLSLMGGDAEPQEINRLAELLRKEFPELKIAWYSGRQVLDKAIQLQNFDFVKLGPYQEEDGALNSPTTNQRFYKVVQGQLIDKTFIFWK